MVGIKKLGCLGVLSRKTSKNPKRMNLTRRVSGRTHMANGEESKRIFIVLCFFKGGVKDGGKSLSFSS